MTQVTALNKQTYTTIDEKTWQHQTFQLERQICSWWITSGKFPNIGVQSECMNWLDKIQKVNYKYKGSWNNGDSSS